MIVKNISPYPRQLTGLGISLMPGQQQDISRFSQKERDECFELQEAFRKGEFVCIGVGIDDKQEPDSEVRAQRAFAGGHTGRQPLQKIKAVYVPRVENVEELHRRYEPSDETKIERVYKYDRPQRQEVEDVDNPTGFIQRGAHGGVSVEEIETQPFRPDVGPAAPTLPEPVINPLEVPKITKERAREIIQSTQCISFRSNGKKCRRRPVAGYDYCVTHMPDELREEYKRTKKDAFFKS